MDSPHHRTLRRTAGVFAAAALIASCGGSDDASPSDDVSEAGESDAATAGETEADEETVDVAAGDGIIGSGTLTVTLEDGRSFEFSGDCEINVDGGWRYNFAYQDENGGIASSAHSVDADGASLVMPSALQFTDDDLWIYRGTEFTNTTSDDSSWSSGVVVEGAIDNEPFRLTGELTSTCS